MNVCIVELTGCRLCGGKGRRMCGKGLGGGRKKSAKKLEEDEYCDEAAIVIVPCMRAVRLATNRTRRG